MTSTIASRTLAGFTLRVFLGVLLGLALLLLSFAVWEPGLEVQDGRHDRGQNGLWIAHGWLGGDEWFIRYGKTNEFLKYRSPENIETLALNLRRHGVRDVFPHLCPADFSGKLPPVHPMQVERFLNLLGDGSKRIQAFGKWSD